MGRMSYTYEQYRRAMDMYRSGVGPSEISKTLGIKGRTIRCWIYEHKVLWLARWSPEPSRELAYVLGVLYGDGYIVKPRKNI